jgi:hypothetical protein
MKTKLFLFIFLSFAIIGCENKIEQEETPSASDTTAINPPETTTTWTEKVLALLGYLRGIPTSEMVTDYDYPSFIREAIARYEIDPAYNILGRVRIFAGELDSRERRFLIYSSLKSCAICDYYNENGENVSSDNNETSSKSFIDVKNWTLIYDLGNKTYW